MHRLRSVIRQKCVHRGLNAAMESICATKSTVVTSTSSQLRTILSRSRPPPGKQEQTLISRLPAWASSTRLFASEANLNNDEVQRKVEDISEKFKEAMELLDDARSSAGTVYFSEDMTDAENAIEEVLSDYDRLLKEMNEDQKRSVIRTIGLKIEELKAQVQMLRDSLKE